MKKHFLRMLAAFLCLSGLALFMISCSRRLEEKKEVPFEISKETELPDELLALIEKKKEEAFHFTYENTAWCYLVVGYGMQPQGEYVVAVRQIYETPSGIYVDTILIGLSHAQNQVTGNPSAYPYVVIRCKKSGKNVFFL